MKKFDDIFLHLDTILERSRRTYRRTDNGRQQRPSLRVGLALRGKNWKAEEGVSGNKFHADKPADDLEFDRSRPAVQGHSRSSELTRINPPPLTSY